MLGLDDAIAGAGSEGGLLLAALAALLLGLRHATDPDHVTAVSTLVLSGGVRDGRRRAATLGAAWGAGHAITLLIVGLPVVLAGSYLPEAVQRAAELAVGVLIVVLAARLLVRWRRGYLHTHVHAHGGVRHAHPHAHEHGQLAAAGHDRGGSHDHRHAEDLGRTPLAALGIGLVHGAGGSAGAAILLMGAFSDRADALLGLMLFAGGSAVAMIVASSAFVVALSREPVLRRLRALVPAFGTLTLLFGVWYALGALETVPYYF